jgi:hypothetical protein
MLHRPMCTTWGKLAVVVTKLQVRGHRPPTAAVDSFSLRPPGVACLGVSRPPSRLLIDIPPSSSRYLDIHLVSGK